MAHQLSSKNEVPYPSGTLQLRRRLIDRVSTASGRNLFVICAPAGYGKTTLAFQALKSVPSKHRAWLTIDELDATAPRFAHEILKSLSNCNHKLFGELLEQGVTSAEDISKLLDEFSFLCREYRGSPIWFVLDNWEHVNHEKPICDFVNRLIKFSNGKIKFIVTSRVRPGIKIGKLLEGGRAELIEQEDLEFTFEEFVGIAKKRLEKSCPTQILKDAWKQSRGWGIQVGLLISCLNRINLDSTTELSKLYQQTAKNYVLEEILEALSPETVEFLTKTSPLIRISVDSCLPLFKDSAYIHRQLDEIKSSGIPVVASVDDNSTSLHPLIREALKDRFAKRYSPVERKEIIETVHQYYISSGQIIGGIELLIGNSMYEDAVEEMNRQWWSILQAGEHGIVRKWLDSAPENIRCLPSYISVRCNLYMIDTDYRSLESFLNEHFFPEKFEKGSASLGKLWVQHQWSRIFLGIAVSYDELREQWESLDSRYGPFEDYVVAIAHFPLFLTASHELSLDTAARHIQTSLASIEEEKFELWMTAKTNLAFLLCYGGAIASGRIILEEMKRACLKNGSFAVAYLPYVNLIRTHYLECKFENVFATIEEFSRITSNHPQTFESARPYLESIEGATLVQMGRVDKGINLLIRAAEEFKGQNFTDHVETALDVEFYSAVSGKPVILLDEEDRPPEGAISANRLKQLILYLYNSAKNDEYRSGLHFLAELEDIVAENDVAPWCVTVHLHAVFFCFAFAKYEKMGRHLHEALCALETIDWRTYHCPCDEVTSLAILLAVAKNIKVEHALMLLSNDKNIDFTSGCSQVFSSNAISDSDRARLLRFVIENNVRGLRDVLKGLAEKSNSEIEALVDQYNRESPEYKLPPLTIEMLNGFRAYAGSRLVLIKRKKSRMLLEILSLNYPASVHEEVIIEYLWPSRDIESGRRNLQTSVSELRKSLDPYSEPREASYIIYEDYHYRLDIPGRSFIDYVEVKKFQGEVLSRIGKSEVLAPPELERLRVGIKSFAGTLLPASRYERYAVEHREEMQNLYLTGVMCMAKSYERQGEVSKAVLALDSALKVDPLWADGVEVVITFLIKQKRSLKALRYFREYEKRLKEDLNLKPDISIQELIAGSL
jgi:DNA-binding SARP family transcriptional activator